MELFCIILFKVEKKRKKETRREEGNDDDFLVKKNANIQHEDLPSMTFDLIFFEESHRPPSSPHPDEINPLII